MVRGAFAFRPERGIAWVLVVLFSLAVSTSDAQDLSVRVRSQTIAFDDMVTMEITLDGAQVVSIGSPESNDFVIARRSTSQQMRLGPGGMQIRSSVTLELRPTRSGLLTLGPIPLETSNGLMRTDPVSVSVSGGTGTPAPPPPSVPSVPVPGGPAPPGVAPAPPTRAPAVAPSGEGGGRTPVPLSPDMFSSGVPVHERGEPFLVTSISHDAAVVGQQLLVDYLLYSPVMEIGAEATGLSEPEFAGFWFRDVTESRQRELPQGHTVSVEGDLYQVAMVRSYIIVPLRAGALSVPSLSLQVRLRGFFRAQGDRNLRTSAVQLPVTETPEEGRPAGFEAGNVGRLTFDAQTEPRTARVGDGVNITMRATGSALFTNVLLPSLRELDGARVFDPDDEVRFEVGRSGWLEGSVTRRISIVPRREGSLWVPPLNFSWYDPGTGTYGHADSERMEIRVEGVNPNAADTGDAAQSGEAWLDRLPGERPIDSSAAFARDYSPPLSYWVALGLPPMGLALASLAGRVARRRAETAGQRRSDGATRRAKRALRALDPVLSEAAASVATVLREWLADRTGTPTRGRTLDGLRALAESLGSQSAASRFVGVVERSDCARYEQPGAEEVEALIADALQAIDLVEGDAA